MNNQVHIFNYLVKNQTDRVLDIHVDGEIVDAATQELLKNWFNDETSTSFKSLRGQVEIANPNTINIYVNSTGGHVGDAMAIHDYLTSKESQGVTVNRFGIGIIASAATYILMGKNSQMSENSFLGIHNVQSFAFGDIVQMENQIKNIRKFNDSIVEFYSNKTGKTKDEISSWMDAETWFTANEAKDAGFVESVTGQVQFSEPIPQNKWEYKNQHILQVYNSFTNKNSSFMETNKILDAIKNSFEEIKKLFNREGAKPTTEEIDEAITKASNSIVDAIKEMPTGISEDDVKKLITNQIAEFKFITPESLTNALNDHRDTLMQEVSKVIGNKTDPPEEEKNRTQNNSRRNKNRFSGAKNWEVQN
jgi:ATP-dependent protease ClpP protease subunit